MAIKNPFSFTSRTFQSLLNDINTDSELVDKPNWFKRIWAGIGDWFSIVINAIANNLYLGTAYTRNAVKDLCALIDYTLTAHTTSNGIALFYVDTSLGTGIYPFTVQKGNLKARSQGSLSASSKLFESRVNVSFTLVQNNFTVTPATDLLTVSLDFEYTGHKVRVSTTGTLPVPLVADIDYYVIYVNATTIKLANTLADAFAGNVIDITTTGAGTHTLTLYSKAITVYQQETLDNTVIIGTSDGITEWQEFDIPDHFMLDDTLTININGVPWTLVSTFIDSGASDTHYIVFPKSENQFAIRFGNGTYGAIPGEFDIEALYSYGGGALSNISSLNVVNVYAGNDSNLLGVTNATTMSGGADEESIASAKKLAPVLLKTRDRFITVADGEALVLNYGGVSQVKINKNVFGLLSCQVIGIATGGGNPSASVRTAIENYLIDRSVLQSIDVRFETATITSINVTSAAKILAGYVYVDIEPYFELAYQLFLSETGKEIQDKYEDDGLEDAITLINSIFTSSFDNTDTTTRNQIQKLIENLTPREFGDTITESDVYGYVDAYVDGIDYITISVFGGGLPISNADDEITTVGTLLLSEIP